MRVLHLVECLAGGPGRAATADADVLACRAAVEGTPGLRHDVWLLADAQGEQRARQLGLRTTDRITPPGRRSWMAWRALRRMASVRPRADVVQAWSAGALRAARLAFPAGVPILAEPTTFPVPVAPATEPRDRLRRALGIDGSTVAILLIADPPDEAAAARFTFLIGLLDFAGHRVAGVLASGTPGGGRARAFYRRAVLECPVRFSSLPAAVLAPACDVGVLHAAHEPMMGPGAAVRRRGAAVRAAHRQGLPVVCPSHSGVTEVCQPARLEACAPLVCERDKPADYAKIVAGLLVRAGGIAAVAGMLGESDDHETCAVVALRWAEAAAGRAGAAT